MLILVMCGASPHKIGEFMWEEYPTMQALIKMTTSGRYRFPTADCDDFAKEVMKKGEVDLREQVCNSTKPQAIAFGMVADYCFLRFIMSTCHSVNCSWLSQWLTQFLFLRCTLPQPKTGSESHGTFVPAKISKGDEEEEKNHYLCANTHGFPSVCPTAGETYKNSCFAARTGSCRCACR